MKNYYALLEVHSKASETEIRKAYHRIAKRIHPDLHPDDTQAEQRQRQRDFVQLTQAYETLSNPDKRATHERKLRAARMRSSAQRDQKPRASTSSYSRARSPSARQGPGKAGPRPTASETDTTLEELLAEVESLLQRFGLEFRDPLSMLGDWARKVFRETVEMWDDTASAATETPKSRGSTVQQKHAGTGEPLDGIEEELLRLKKNAGAGRKTRGKRKAQSSPLPTDAEIEIEMQRLKRKYKRL